MNTPRSRENAQKRRPVVWVADDVEMEAQAARRALQGTYDVELFPDGSSVVERAATGSLPDLLVLDWHMAGMAGLDVCEFFRATERTVSLPILIFTATGDEQDLLQALASGADDYVSKGASDAELNARVGALLRSKHLLERAESAERSLEQILLHEREARAEAEAANRAKDLFLATVSHELRTPLNAILGWSRLLNAGLDPGRQARAIETIERNARAQARIVDDLLDLSRIVTGKLRLDLVPIDASEELMAVIEAQRPTATAKRVSLDAEIEPGVVIAGDSSRVQQIASNLLSNAIKFTRADGHVRVTLAREGDTVALRIADDGVGIAPELLPHVFDRFRQGDSTTTRSHGGLGLGLAIVRELAELHHARVGAKSTGVGGGATFEVAFPATSLPVSAEAVAEPNVGDVHGARVLVVDDDPDGLDVAAQLLAYAGAEVRTAASVDDALATLHSWSPDVLVSDLAMPERDGLDLIRTVRAESAGGSPPAIALTALAREEDRAQAIEAGFQTHLAKPVDADELLRTIARLVSERRAARPLG
ncbi:MAG: response regulator [Myxococcota bacterium]|nr:response regulator [Myxococcota bacterium]